VFDTTLSSVYAALYKAAEDTVAENDTPLIEDNTLVVEETEVPLGGGSGGGSSGGGGYSYGSGGGSDSGNSGNSGNSNNGGGDNTGGVNLEPTITVATAFVSGETTQYAVDVTYTATASAGASVSEVSYSINGGAAEYLYLRGGDGVSAKGTLGAGRVLLTPDENSIVFTVKDTAGKTAVFAVAEKPVYVFGTTPEYDDQYISASATNEGWQYVTNRIVAFAQSGVSDELIYAAVSGIDGTIVGRVNVIDMYFIQFESSLSEAELTAKCEALTTGDAAVFESAVLDLISSATVEAAPTNDPWWNVANRQWGLDAIQAPEAWASYGGYFRDVKVGVSDNGFLNTHEDLQIPASNVFNRFLGSDDHGTHVIGTIGAVQNNNKGLAGVVNARRSDLYGYDVFTLTDDGVQGARTPEAMEIAGLAWNVQHGAKVINYSIGRDEGTNWASRSAHYNSYYGLAMNKLLDGGYDFVVVNAAGNDAVDANRNGGFVGVTDSEWVSRIIVVGATDKNGDIASFSNYGGRVDVVAPGVDIYSTIATSSTAYANYQGTSMAAPHVTGVAALVWAANPGISGTQVKQIIVDSANESGLAVEDTRGGSIPRQTYHQVNAKAAVAKAIGETPALTAGRLAGKIVNAANTDVGIGGAVIALYSGINDPPVRTTTSGTDGQYVIDNIATGRYYLTIAADGYVPETGFVQIEAGVTTFFHQLNAVPASSENGTVSGSVINAFTGSVVSGTAITLDFRRGIDYNPDSPGNIVGTTTAANGAYAISLPAGNYTVTASGDGYITTKAYVYALGGQSVANQNVVISPVFEEGAMGAVRIVLTWGELPSDLDSHLVGPAAGGGDFHIYFGDQNYGSYANLDVDDVTSYGPETVTINTLFDGTYDYYVHDFTNRSSTTSDYLRNSQAVVRIYSSDNELLRTFNVPTGGGASTIWSVFSLEVTDGVYRIVPVNTMHNEVTSASNVGRRSTQDYENGNEAYPEYPGVDENPFGSYDAYLGEEEDIIGDGTEEYPDFLGAESLLGEEGLIGGAEEPFPLSQE
ncbi:MAG: S8 family serine peptidase, partial [Peptococcaceae bacterium]|nr:S8 family serine peptidase [Peptococcaceae bacterium]